MIWAEEDIDDGIYMRIVRDKTADDVCGIYKRLISSINSNPTKLNEWKQIYEQIVEI